MRHHRFSRVFAVCIILDQTKSTDHRSDTSRIENVWRLRQRTEKSIPKSFTQCFESHDGHQCGRYHWYILANWHHTKGIHYNRWAVWKPLSSFYQFSMTFHFQMSSGSSCKVNQNTNTCLWRHRNPRMWSIRNRSLTVSKSINGSVKSNS